MILGKNIIFIKNGSIHYVTKMQSLVHQASAPLSISQPRLLILLYYGVEQPKQFASIEKYYTYRAQVRRHMKRRGYWGEGLPASFKFHFFFLHTGTLILLGCFKTCYCSFYACVLSALLHRLRCIMPDYAAGVNGQKSWEVNISGRAILALIFKK